MLQFATGLVIGVVMATAGLTMLSFYIINREDQES